MSVRAEVPRCMATCMPMHRRMTKGMFAFLVSIPSMQGVMALLRGPIPHLGRSAPGFLLHDSCLCSI